MDFINIAEHYNSVVLKVIFAISEDAFSKAMLKELSVTGTMFRHYNVEIA